MHYLWQLSHYEAELCSCEKDSVTLKIKNTTWPFIEKKKMLIPTLLHKGSILTPQAEDRVTALVALTPQELFCPVSF